VSEMPLVKHNLTQQMSIALRMCHGDYSVFFFKRLILRIFPDYVGQMLNVTIPATLCLRERVKWSSS